MPSFFGGRGWNPGSVSSCFRSASCLSHLKLDENDPHAELVRTVLAEEGLELRQMQIKDIREMFFSRGERVALCLPRDLTHEFAADENHRGREKLALAFELPRGSYATLLVKALGEG